MSIKAILWDIDGTLLSFTKAEEYAIRKCFEVFCLGECSDEMLSRYSKINISYWEQLERGEISKAELLDRRFIDFFTEYGMDSSKAHDFNLEYQFRLSEKIIYMDYGREILEHYKGKLKQYIVTNGTKSVQNRKLSASGIANLTDGCFISDEIGCEKPSRDFFEYVFSVIGEYDKDEIMIVGDSLTSDMRGGIQSGIVTCWFNPDNKPGSTEIIPDYTISGLKEVINIVGF